MRYLIFALPLLAQTTVPPSMLREANALDSPSSQIKLYAGDAKGNLLRVRPGAGLKLRSTADGLVLEAAVAPVRIVRRVLQRNAAGHYVVSPDAVIYCNGIAMTLGVDFSLDGNSVLPIGEWQADDIVTADAIEPAER